MSDHKDLAITTLLESEFVLQERVASLEADNAIYQQLVREGVAMLHGAETRDKRQCAAIAALLAEVRRLRGQQQQRRVA